MSDAPNVPPAGNAGQAADPHPSPRPRPAPAAPAASVSPVPPEPPVPVPVPPAEPGPVAGVGPVPTEYSETLVAGSQLITSVVIALILAVVLVGIRTSLWPFAIVVFVAVGAAGVYLAGVSVTATRTYVEIGQGRGERTPRRISNDEIVAASAAELTWAQVYGVGLPRGDRTTRSTRYTVRPGATLVLDLTSGETVRVSTPDPLLALAVLGRRPA
ncbi:hypothetical protein [Jatrophihabitans endophyticus]|uniref:hypothetical protein n=1 Tax=Jatrophihabitans endophyticus TaxID=1206085 RepID=UPI0019FBACA0|nr:hypothetical protein [Jatrophihabitans endophyticus]MBE7189387.1 hypothetical protein [Jatrophihabitans endophyticus]